MARRLPMVAVTKPYPFESETDPHSLADLFASWRQLIVYHFMLDPTPYGRQEPLGRQPARLAERRPAVAAPSRPL